MTKTQKENVPVELIREAMEIYDDTAEEFARRVGVTQGTVFRWLAGKNQSKQTRPKLKSVMLKALRQKEATKERMIK